MSDPDEEVILPESEQLDITADLLNDHMRMQVEMPKPVDLEQVYLDGRALAQGGHQLRGNIIKFKDGNAQINLPQGNDWSAVLSYLAGYLDGIVERQEWESED